MQGKFGGSYFIGFNKSDYISEGEVEQCTFNNVSMENIDASSFFITAEYIGNKEFAIPITLAANDVAQLYSADSKKHFMISFKYILYFQDNKCFYFSSNT